MRWPCQSNAIQFFSARSRTPQLSLDAAAPNPNPGVVAQSPSLISSRRASAATNICTAAVGWHEAAAEDSAAMPDSAGGGMELKVRAVVGDCC